jgi:hypothetical protein
MNTKDYLYPSRIVKTISKSLRILKNKRKYSQIIKSLEEEGKLEAIGLKREKDFLYVGINLNPELLIYDESTQESAELKFISDKMRKYTDFLQKESVLDSVIADYDRVRTEEFYGYIVQIKFSDKGYSKNQFYYSLAYFSVVIGIMLSVIALVF